MIRKIRDGASDNIGIYFIQYSTVLRRVTLLSTCSIASPVGEYHADLILHQPGYREGMVRRLANNKYEM